MNPCEQCQWAVWNIDGNLVVGCKMDNPQEIQNGSCAAVESPCADFHADFRSCWGKKEE